MLARKAQLERAKAHLERLAEKWEPVFRATGASSGERVNAAPTAPLALVAGALNEIRIEDWRERPSALSFALALAGMRARAGMRAQESGAIVFLQLAHEARGEGALFARGLAALGVDPARLVVAFVRNEKQLLWALEEAAREKSVAAVIAEAPKTARLIDLTATRRLALAAEASGASPLLVRTMASPAPTAAFIRWRIESAPSLPPADDEKSPGSPRWRVFLERCRAGTRLCGGAPFIAEIKHDGRNVFLEEAAALPFPLPALLGDGAPEAQGRRAAREPGAARAL